MKNFRQEIYSRITGITGAWSLGHDGRLTSYYKRSPHERLNYIKEIAQELIELNPKYANTKIYRYIPSYAECQRICDAIENKEEYICATACYDSLKDKKCFE